MSMTKITNPFIHIAKNPCQQMFAVRLNMFVIDTLYYFRSCTAQCNSGYQFENGASIASVKCDLFEVVQSTAVPKCVRIDTGMSLLSYHMQSRLETEYYSAQKNYCRYSFEPRHEKTSILVSDLVRHKPGCTATHDG